MSFSQWLSKRLSVLWLWKDWSLANTCLEPRKSPPCPRMTNSWSEQVEVSWKSMSISNTMEMQNKLRLTGQLKNCQLNRPQILVVSIASLSHQRATKLKNSKQENPFRSTSHSLSTAAAFSFHQRLNWLSYRKILSLTRCNSSRLWPRRSLKSRMLTILSDTRKSTKGWMCWIHTHFWGCLRNLGWKGP